MIEAQIIDKNNYFVGNANDNNIQFNIINGSGTIYGVGSGSPNSHEQDKGTNRTVFNGGAIVLISSLLNKPSTTHINAKSNGLISDIIYIDSVDPSNQMEFVS